MKYDTETKTPHPNTMDLIAYKGNVALAQMRIYSIAAMRAINASSLAYFLSGSRKISFDLVVQTMYETGTDLKRSYRETAESGLAKPYKK